MYVQVPALKRLREQACLSLRDLSDRSEVAKSAIASLESGRRAAHPTTVRRLAKALHCSPRDLMEAQP